VRSQDLEDAGLGRLELRYVRAHGVELPADVAQVLKDDVVGLVGHGHSVVPAGRVVNRWGEFASSLPVLSGKPRSVFPRCIITGPGACAGLLFSALYGVRLSIGTFRTFNQDAACVTLRIAGST
jgi:hypothetical protein